MMGFLYTTPVWVYGIAFVWVFLTRPSLHRGLKQKRRTVIYLREGLKRLEATIAALSAPETPGRLGTPPAHIYVVNNGMSDTAN